jgi:hypothetical protein
LEKATQVIESAQLIISIGSHDDTLLLCTSGWCQAPVAVENPWLFPFKTIHTWWVFVSSPHLS